jgi:hypothetical protein
MLSMENAEDARPSPASAPAPGAPDRPHGDPLAPAVPTEAPEEAPPADEDEAP